MKLQNPFKLCNDLQRKFEKAMREFENLKYFQNFLYEIKFVKRTLLARGIFQKSPIDS